jgi:hypothetical protein
MLAACAVALTWAPAILGLGAILRIQGDPALRPGITGFLGLGVAGVSAASLNFWFALTPSISAAIWATGTVLFAIRFKWIFGAFDFRDTVVLVLLLAVASSAMRRPGFHYDTVLYHLQAVQWITERSLYAGIANVHFRLGFNSIWWGVAATVEHPLAVGKSAFFLNQLPILFAGQVAIVGLKRLAAGVRSFANLMLAGVCLPIASATFGIGGLYVDYTASIVVYLALALWAHAWEAGDRFGQEAEPAALLSVLAGLLSISAAVLPAVSLLGLAVHRPGLPFRWWLRAGSISVVAAVPWLARGLTLSGCFVFPVWTTCINRLPWVVPESKTRSVAAIIKSWAQRPASPHDGSLAWAREWPGRNLDGYPELRVLLFTAVLGLALWLVRPRRVSKPAMGVLVMASMGATFWFFAAPEPRFGLGFLFALGLAPLFSGLAAANGLHEKRVVRVTLATVMVVGSIGLALALYGHSRAGNPAARLPWRPPLLDWPTMPRARVKVMTTESGFRIYAPLLGETCGASSIPCTPDAELDPSLRFDGYFTVAH